MFVKVKQDNKVYYINTVFLCDVVLHEKTVENILTLSFLGESYRRLTFETSEKRHAKLQELIGE